MANFHSQIELNTLSDVRKFVNKMSTVDSPVYLVDEKNFKVSAKSLMGALYTLEWEQLWVESDTDLGDLISEFRV